MKYRYAVWRDHSHNIYEIVRWGGDDAKDFVVVQTNIRTVEKANAAKVIWQQREQERQDAAEKA